MSDDDHIQPAVGGRPRVHVGDPPRCDPQHTESVRTRAMSLSLEERKKRLAEEQAAYDEEMQMRSELETRVQKLRQSRADLYAEQVCDNLNAPAHPAPALPVMAAPVSVPRWPGGPAPLARARSPAPASCPHSSLIL